MIALEAIASVPAGAKERDLGYAAQEESIWRSPLAWGLLLPFLFLAAGGFPLSQNNPDVFLTGSDSILMAPSYEPYGSFLQFGIWFVMAIIMRPWLGQAIRLLWKNKVMASLMVLILVSSLWAPEPLVSFRRGVLVDLTLFLAFYLSVRFTQKQQLDLIFGLGVFCVVTSFLTALLLPAVNSSFGDGWQGVFGHKNHLGMFLSFFLSTAFFMAEGKLPTKIFRGAALLLGAVLIGLSRSRGGWLVAIALLGYVAVTSFLDRFEKRNGYLVILTSLPLVAGLVALLTANLDNLAYALGKDPGLSNRTIIWGALWPSILKRPLLGYGFGGFWNGLTGESANIMLVVGTSISHAHNGALNVWLQVGAVGLGLILLATFIAAVNSLRCLGTQPNRYFLWYGSLLLMTIVGSVDESFLLTQNTLTTTLWALACIELQKCASGLQKQPNAL